jgi:molybdopterin molybdotransferase
MSMDFDSPQRIARLTPLADVLARIDALVKPVVPRSLPTAAAVGRVVAGDVDVALRPRVSLALRDGWAVSSELTTDASSYAPVPLTAAARIEVGQPMPAGADAVAPYDAVLRRHGQVEIIAAVGAGEGVLPAGADANRQAIFAASGTRLAPGQAAALAAAGLDGLYVHEPVLRVVRARARPDRIVAAAVDLVAAEIIAAGGRVLQTDNADDMPLADALADEAADAVIAIGGTGSGHSDASVTTLAKSGRVEAHGIALAPGETAAFGLVASRPVLLLPGRLDAALAVWLVIGRHLMARLTGSHAEEPTTTARLVRKVSSALGLAEVVPVRLHDGAAEPIASGYVPLSRLARANGFMLVPPDSEGYPPGSEVVIRPWP